MEERVFSGNIFKYFTKLLHFNEVGHLDCNCTGRDSGFPLIM